MKALAVAVGVLFGLAHLLAAIQLMRAGDAARGSGEAGAVPHGARFGMLAAGVVTILGAATQVLPLLVLGVAGIVGLAIANGVWMHGRPTVQHHLVRVAAAVVVLGLAFAA